MLGRAFDDPGVFRKGEQGHGTPKVSLYLLDCEDQPYSRELSAAVSIPQPPQDIDLAGVTFTTRKPDSRISPSSFITGPSLADFFDPPNFQLLGALDLLGKDMKMWGALDMTFPFLETLQGVVCSSSQHLPQLIVIR